jgi:hypothetical protein
MFLSLFVALIFRKDDHLAVSAFRSSGYTVRQRASTGYNTFLMNSYLDNLPYEANNTSPKIGSIMSDTKSDLRRLTSSLNKVSNIMATRKTYVLQDKAIDPLETKSQTPLDNSISVMSANLDRSSPKKKISSRAIQNY